MCAARREFESAQGRQGQASSLKAECKRQERAIEQLEQLVAQKTKARRQINSILGGETVGRARRACADLS